MQARHTRPAYGPSPSPATSACPVEAIAAAYLTQTFGDPALALRCAITDALADLLESERRTRERLARLRGKLRSRLISRGFVRGRLDDTGDAL